MEKLNVLQMHVAMFSLPADADTLCNACLSRSKLNTNWNSKAKVCTDASTTSKTHTDCTAHRKGCVTNGGGFLDSALNNCVDYKGDRASCSKFKGLHFLCSKLSVAFFIYSNYSQIMWR